MSVFNKIKKLLKKKKTMEMKYVEKKTLYDEKRKEFHKLVDKFNTGKYNKQTLNDRIIQLKDEMIDMKKEIEKIRNEVAKEMLDNKKDLNKDVISLIKLYL